MSKSVSSCKKGLVKKVLIGMFLLVLYLVSSVPVGLFLYSLKSELFGVNIFTNTGFHSYMYCLQEQVGKISDDSEDLTMSESEGDKVISLKN